MNPASRDEAGGRSDGARLGRPAVSADSPCQAPVVRSHASPQTSHRPEDGADRAASADKRQHRLVPIDRDALY